MLNWVLSAFFVLAIMTGALGFIGLAGSATWIVQMLFFLFVIAFVTGLYWRRRGWDGK
jgi:uncharacterized membrane protein YtjA (UPF0391 family)